MKIALVCPYGLSTPGGVREHVLGLFHQFKKKNHQVKILTPSERRRKLPDVIYLGKSVKVPTLNKSWGRLSFYFDEWQSPLEDILAQEGFDVIHFQDPIATPFLSWQLLKASQSVNVATFHSAWKKSEFMESLRPFMKFVGTSLVKKLHGVIAVSKTTRDCWSFLFKDRGVIIPNGIDLGCFRSKVKKIERFQDGKLNLLFLGRLERRKGLFYLLLAFKKLIKMFPNLRLIVVGEGPEHLPARLWVKAEGLEEEIKLVGKVSDELKPAYYATADIFCSPAIEGESFGIVLLEAMASGLPLVVFSNPGYRELLQNYPNKKLLVEPQDIEGLIEALSILIRDEKLRKNLGQWGQHFVPRFSWEDVAGQVLDYYEQVLKEVKPAPGA